MAMMLLQLVTMPRFVCLQMVHESFFDEWTRKKIRVTFSQLSQKLNYLRRFFLLDDYIRLRSEILHGRLDYPMQKEKIHRGSVSWGKLILVSFSNRAYHHKNDISEILLEISSESMTEHFNIQ